eukprot:scaffold219381_cov70-Cyclotella_meneghiniana.AAC.5
MPTYLEQQSQEAHLSQASIFNPEHNMDMGSSSLLVLYAYASTSWLIINSNSFKIAKDFVLNMRFNYEV